MPNKNVLNWPSLSTVGINVYPDTLFVADADNNRGYITTIVPNQTKKLWGDEVSDYEANRIAGYPNPKGIYVNEDGEVVNPKFNTNAIIYNPLHVNGDGVLLDALHVMHDSPIYLELFNLYVESIPLGFSPLMDAANDEFGRRGMTIVDKYQRGLPLTKEELEIIEPIYDALLRRLFAPDYMRNIDGGYLDKAELPIIPSIGMSGDLAIKNYLESYPLLEVTVTPNNHADGGPLDWNELSMKDKAAYIRMGVANGYKDIDSIKKVYKEFKKGGPTKEEVFLNSLELSLVKNSRYNTPEWRKFLTDLAFKESSFHSDSLNSIGAKGYFQLMPANRSEVWSYPTQLFEEMYKLTDANILYLRRNMTLEDLNRAEELGIDLYGLIAGAHLGGAKNALKALRGLSNAKDSNNTSVLDYMTKFSQVNSGNFTNIEGRVTPVISPTTVPTIEPAFNKALLREEQFHTELPDALRIASIINNSSRKPEVVIPKPIIVSENDDQTTISGNTLPEVTVTAKAPIDNAQLPLDPLRYFIPQYSLDKPLLQFVSYEPVSTDTAIDRLTQLNNNRNTLLQQDLEDTILRNTLLGTINLDLLRKDVEDLQFYRNMAMNPLALVNSFEDGGEKEKEDGPGFWVRSGLAFSKLIGLDKKYKGEGNRLYAENLYNLVDPTAPYPRGFWDALAFKQIADKAMENKSFPLHRTGHEPLADAAWAKRLGLPYDESYLIDNGDGTYRLNPTYEAEIPTDISFLENRIKANQELLKRYEEKGMDSFDRRQAINKGIQVDTEALKALKETFATGKGKNLNQDANISRKWIDGGAVQYSVSPLSALLNFTIRYNKDNNTLEYSDIYDFNHFEDFVPGKPFTIKGSIKLGDRKVLGGNLFDGFTQPTQQMSILDYANMSDEELDKAFANSEYVVTPQNNLDVQGGFNAAKNWLTKTWLPGRIDKRRNYLQNQLNYRKNLRDTGYTGNIDWDDLADWNYFNDRKSRTWNSGFNLDPNRLGSRKMRRYYNNLLKNFSDLSDRDFIDALNRASTKIRSDKLKKSVRKNLFDITNELWNYANTVGYNDYAINNLEDDIKNFESDPYVKGIRKGINAINNAVLLNPYKDDDSLFKYGYTKDQVKDLFNDLPDTLALVPNDMNGAVYWGGKHDESFEKGFPFVSQMVHELNHIGQHYYGNFPDQKAYSYLKDPKEVDSRLKEFYKLYNISPTKKYSIDDIKYWKENYDKNNNFHLFDIFDDDELLNRVNRYTYVPMIKGEPNILDSNYAAYGGHIYGGLTEDNLKMQIGSKYWETLPILLAFDALLAEFIKLKKEQERIKAELLKLLIEDKERQIAERRADNLLITSNDAIYNPTVSDNSHLMDKAIEGAKAHAAWELEHPNLTSWGTILGATPFAVASVPALTTVGSGIATLGDAAAATSIGQGITNLLTPITTTSYAGATIPQWVDLGLTSGFGAHGIQTAVDEGGISPMTALELAPMLQVAKPIWNTGKDIISDLRTLYNNYPIKNYNLDSVLKSDFYEQVSKLYGKDFADELANKITSPEYRQFLFGNNPREAIKAADKHLRLMQFVKDVENAGGMLGGSGQLARNGSVIRDELMHDVDFFVPGSMEERTSPVFDALGYSSSADPSKNNMVLFGTGYSTPKRPLIVMGGIDKGYINLPKERYGVSADMFIRPDFPSNSTEAVEKILDAKRQFKRPDKDLIDLANYKPYSADNPMIDLATGEGQWNPTLFDNGILTSERYPVIQSVETYPGSGVRVPVMMNYKGQIRTVGLPIALEPSNSIIRTIQDNGKIRLSLPTHTAEKPRLFVLEPAGDNKFYVHMRTWDGDHIPANLSSEDKQALFNALYDELPDGAEILFPKSGPGNYATRGTVVGLQRLARDPRFTPGAKGTLLYLDKDGKVKTYEGTSFIKVPQITPENAIYEANVNPYAYDSKYNPMEFIAYNKISGWPLFPSEANPLNPSFSKDVVKGLPEDVILEMLNNTGLRQVEALINKGVPKEIAQSYIAEAEKLMKDVNVGKYSDKDYIDAGQSHLGGFYNKSRNFISIRNDGTPFMRSVYKHEPRHMLDEELELNLAERLGLSKLFGTDFDNDRIYTSIENMLKDLEDIISKAYDGDFLALPKLDNWNGTPDYLIRNDRLTTNRDARDLIIGDELDIQAQNKMIDEASYNEIFKAVEKANGYGRRYIEYLRKHNKLIPEKAQAFREAMKYVGGLSIPFTIGTGVLNTKQ